MTGGPWPGCESAGAATSSAASSASGIVRRRATTNRGYPAPGRHRVWTSEERHGSRLEVEEHALALEPAAEAREAAVGADHAVARDDHGDRVAAVRAADRPRAVAG